MQKIKSSQNTNIYIYILEALAKVEIYRVNFTCKDHGDTYTHENKIMKLFILQTLNFFSTVRKHLTSQKKVKTLALPTLEVIHLRLKFY